MVVACRIYGFLLLPAVYYYFFSSSSGVMRNGLLALLLDRQCVGYTVTSSNRVAADSLFLSCLPKKLFSNNLCLLQNIPDSSIPLYDCQKIFMEWGRGKSTK
jgi:hypothetical protein